jgi:hypothetical protein
MRRWLPVPVLAAAALTLAACSSGSGAQQTSTVYQTVTSGAATGSVAPTSGSGQASITVVPPDGSATPSGSASTTASAPASSTAASSTPKPSSTAASSPATKNVDPLKIDCNTLITATDVKNSIGATLAGGNTQIKDVADPSRGVTGKVRCHLGKKGTDFMIGVVITQFKDTASAATQVKTTISSETDQGAKESSATVAGFPATVLIRQGGLIVMQYSTWTLSVTATNGVSADATLVQGLPKLTQAALARILA